MAYARSNATRLSSWLMASALIVAGGCGDKSDENDSLSGASNADASASETDPTESDSNSETSGPTSPGETSGTSGSFISEPDGGSGANECDIWAQDCAEGQKCMPWANDGGDSWNATKCSPVNANPKQPGDDCTAEGSGVSGVDDCDIAAMCWDIDPETNLGYCVPFCGGSQAAPVCDNPAEGCSISNEGVLILCLPVCHPLLQDCKDGNACYPEENGFFCSPDASGPDLGVYGDPCEFLNVCDAGLWCSEPELVPGCVSAVGCCNEFCDLTEANICSGAAQGQECLPFYLEDAPPGFEDVGTCGIMQ